MRVLVTGRHKARFDEAANDVRGGDVNLLNELRPIRRGVLDRLPPMG